MIRTAHNCSSYPDRSSGIFVWLADLVVDLLNVYRSRKRCILEYEWLVGGSKRRSFLKRYNNKSSNNHGARQLGESSCY